MPAHYGDTESGSAGGSSIDTDDLTEKPPKFSEEQLQYLESIFGKNLRLYKVEDLNKVDTLFQQFLMWNGQQMVLDHIRDLGKMVSDEEEALLKD